MSKGLVAHHAAHVPFSSFYTFSSMTTLLNAVCNDRWAEAWQQSVAHIRRCGITRREVQPTSAATEEQTNPPPASVPAVSVKQPADPLASRKPPADHLWRQMNYATKAAMAQAAADASK